MNVIEKHKYNQDEKIRKKREKRERRVRRDKEGLEKQIPRTIESTREPDPTFVDPDDEEVREDKALDQMEAYFQKRVHPKVLITTSDNACRDTIKFCRQLKQTLGTAEFRWRNRMSVKKMQIAAAERGYTHVLIVNEDRRKPNGILMIHLPEGPTMYFRMSSVKYCEKIKGRARLSHHKPELIVNRFSTRLGHTVARCITTMFDSEPEFHGRRVITFHNQRDYIFVRHHKYEFRDGVRVSLREIGPRFTLKLRWVLAGLFDTKHGEYEWVLKRHEMETSRRRFFL